MKKAPCKGCEERHPGCHAECESYKAWAEARQELNRRMRAEGEDWRAYCAARKQNMRKKDKEKWKSGK